MNTHYNPDIQAQLFVARRDDLLLEAAQRRLADLAQDGQRSKHRASCNWRVGMLSLLWMLARRAALAASHPRSR